jgi:hypothetical protein
MCSSKLLSREGNTKFRKGSNGPAQKRTRQKWIRRAKCERSLMRPVVELGILTQVPYGSLVDSVGSRINRSLDFHCQVLV